MSKPARSGKRERGKVRDEAASNPPPAAAKEAGHRATDRPTYLSHQRHRMAFPASSPVDIVAAAPAAIQSAPR